MPGRTSEAGAASVEYGLLAFAIAALVVLLLFVLGAATADLYADTCQEIDGAIATSQSC